MSYVLDQVRRIDAQLDRVQLANLPSASASSPTVQRVTNLPDVVGGKEKAVKLLALQTAIRGLTPHNALLAPAQIATFLSALSGGEVGAEEARPSKEPYEVELEWLLVSKATAQTYGYALKVILDNTVALAEDISYWDDVLYSRRYSALYGIQTSPLRFWHWSCQVWEDVRARGGNFSITGARQDAADTIGKRWQDFYGLVRQVVRERSVEEINKQVLSPVTRLRGEIRRKQHALKKVRSRNANALGVLLGEGLANESSHGEALANASIDEAQHRWKSSVARNVALMEAVLAKANDVDTPVEKFDAAVAELTDEDPLYGAEIYSDVEGGSVSIQPDQVAERLSRCVLYVSKAWNAS
jgi:nuclear control of ATPase protein 2